MAVPALVAALSVLLVRRAVPLESREPAAGWCWLAAALIVAAASVLIIGLPSVRPSPAPKQATLRVMQYNVQQGCSRTGEKSFRSQLDVIRRIAPDVIGLEETDTARMAGGNSDVVRFLADRWACARTMVRRPRQERSASRSSPATPS